MRIVLVKLNVLRDAICPKENGVGIISSGMVDVSSGNRSIMRVNLAFDAYMVQCGMSEYTV